MTQLFNKSLIAALSFLFFMATSPITNAVENPFGMSNLPADQMQMAGKDGKCGEGKCGGSMKKKASKCGDSMKKKEGKCGGSMEKKEGKCGGSMEKKEGKCGDSMKKKEGKCGEGKCGGK